MGIAARTARIRDVPDVADLLADGNEAAVAEVSEHVVERAVFEHYHDNVLDRWRAGHPGDSKGASGPRHPPNRVMTGTRPQRSITCADNVASETPAPPGDYVLLAARPSIVVVAFTMAGARRAVREQPRRPPGAGAACGGEHRSLTKGTRHDRDAAEHRVLLLGQLRLGELGCYGGGVLRGAPTPRIDGLASNGLKLLNFNVEAQCTRADRRC
jgi:hypothetical protein